MDLQPIPLSGTTILSIHDLIKHQFADVYTLPYEQQFPRFQYLGAYWSGYIQALLEFQLISPQVSAHLAMLLLGLVTSATCNAQEGVNPVNGCTGEEAP